MQLKKTHSQSNSLSSTYVMFTLLLQALAKLSQIALLGKSLPLHPSVIHS